MRETNRLRVFVGAALIAAILYICFFSGLDALGLVGPDEPRYAAIAREMAVTGDWVTPRLFGQPWLEKPVLYYWSAALAFRSGLTNETAARLPSGIFALLATLGMAWTARRIYGDRTALTLLLMLPTCAGMIGFAHAAATDMPFAACLALAMVAAAELLWPAQRAQQAAPLRHEQKDRQEPACAWAWAWACAWGFFLSLAALAKGPAALALSAGSVGLWVLATRRWRDAWRLFHPVAIATFCLTALPWYVVCALRNPTFLRVFFLEHNIERFATNRYQHAQPFWFFAPILLLAIFPWTFLLGASALDGYRVFREKRLAESRGFFFACWALFPFLFFSVSQSKLPGYILPAVPPLMLLIARSLDRRTQKNDPALRGWLSAVTLAFLLLVLGAFAWLRSVTPQPIPAGASGSDWAFIPNETDALNIILAILLASGVITLLALLRRTRAAVWTAVLSVALLVATVDQWLLPLIDARLSPRAAAGIALRRAGGADRLAVYRIQRAWSFGLNYYVGRVIPEWTPQPHPAWVITNDAGYDELRRLDVPMSEEQRVSWQAAIVKIE